MNKIIYFCGLGYSGTSAVIDALYDQEHIIGVSKSYPDETSLYSKEECPLLFVDNYSERNRIDINGIISLITGGRLGLDKSVHKSELEVFFRDLHIKTGGIRILNQKAYSSFTEEELSKIIKNVIKKDSITTEEFKMVYDEILDQLNLLLINKANKFIAFNNDPPLYALNYSENFNGAVCVVVVRNPEDMIADSLRSKFTQKQSFLGKFNRIAQVLKLSLRKKRLLEKTVNLKKTHKDKIIIIRFEKFVLDESYRNSFISKITASKPAETQGKYFNESDSAKNVESGDRLMNLTHKLLVRLICHNAYSKLLKLIHEKQKV